MASNNAKVTLDVAIQTQQEQIDELETKLRQLQQERIQVRLEAHTEELEQVTQEINETRNRLDDLKASVSVDNTEIERLESELEDTQSQLENLNADVTVDASEVEKLESHAEELQSKLDELQASVSVDNTEIDELESKLDALEATQLDLQINITKDEIDAAAASMEDLKNSADDATNSTDNLNSSLGMLDAMGSLQVAEALSNYGGEAEQMAQDMNQAAISVGQLATQTGIAEPQMVSLINHISNATFPNDEAMMYVKSLDQIGVASENLGKSATDLDKINDAFGLGASTVNSLGQELGVLGVDMNNVSSAFNALAYANANTVGGMENYYSFLRKYDAQFKELGYNVDQASVIIAGATHKFGGGRAALTGLSEALETANGDSRKLEEALGLQAGALDNASQLTGQYEGQLQQLADEEAEHKSILDQISAAWEDISLSLSPVLSPLSSFMGLIGQAGSWAVGLNGMWELGNKFRGLSIVDSIGGKVNSFKQKLGNLGSSAANAASNLGSNLFNALKNVGGMAKTAALEIGKFTLKIMKSGWEALTTAGSWLFAKGALVAQKLATMAAATAQEFLNLVMSMNPVMLVVIAITALIAILAYLYFTNEDVRAAIDGLGQALYGIGETIYGYLVGAFNWLQGAWQNTVDWFSNGSNTISDTVTGAFTWLSESVTGSLEWLNEVWQGTVDWFTGGATTISDTVTGAFNWLMDTWNNLVNAFNTYAPLVAQVLFVMATGGIGAIILLIANMNGMPNQIGAILQSVINRVISFVSNLVSNFINGATSSVNNFINKIKEMPSRFKAELDRMIQDAINFATNLPNIIAQAAGSMVLKWSVGSGEHSPGFMHDAFSGELDAMKKLAQNTDIDMSGTAEDMVKSWGNPELAYQIQQILDKNNDTSSNKDNQSLSELLKMIIDILRNLPKPDGGSFTFNHYGDTDDERRLERIVEAVRREISWNNATAGRDIEDRYGV